MEPGNEVKKPLLLGVLVCLSLTRPHGFTLFAAPYSGRTNLHSRPFVALLSCMLVLVGTVVFINIAAKSYKAMMTG